MAGPQLLIPRPSSVSLVVPKTVVLKMAVTTFPFVSIIAFVRLNASFEPYSMI